MSRPPAFDRELLATQRHLRSYAIRLTKNTIQAEDLVQETILRALEKWELFQPGTNMQAWATTILRNFFISTARKAGRMVEDPDDLISKSVAVPEGQSSAYDLKIVQRRMRLLPTEMRRALNLVAILGNDYELAAERLGVAVGTVKSRVFRARAYLETGVEEPDLAPAIIAPDLPVKLSDQLASLFRAGRSIAEIAEIVSKGPRDVMRLVVDLKLRREPRQQEVVRGV
ncbi:hypothetical protein MesoLjLc_51460 [Mesorhizobium sp. L-8-10]|uniref:sigma-70 family RNA polymerase sigma factor n=1 Tax=Mesorhizobium sp. L-8-10 TaxID=2744523 RepID=UPI00192963AF|nr:sigma-70 family RNA polymerase sigma factor [Mesorhizobium sp. L-8-10]BCH33216.1 hypothetical protein MesoLjLc_51460 [Mesorhizobium sp. L-8-10]